MKPRNFIALSYCVTVFSAQAVVWEFTLSMDGLTAGTPSLGTGGDLHQNFPTQNVPITYDSDLHQLRIPIGWGTDNGFQNLENSLGGAVPLIQYRPISSILGLYTLTPLNDQGHGAGNVDTTITLQDDPRGPGSNYAIGEQEFDLTHGNWFVSVPTVPYGNGEIRGFLTPVPEPRTWAPLTASALLILAAGKRIIRRMSSPSFKT